MIEMRNVLSTKLNKKGFTLAELLVVVAILAILVAVSIPIFTGKLNQAKENTDAANVRAAKAAAVAEYLQGDVDTTKAVYFEYDAENGTVKTSPTELTTASTGTVKGYGKSSVYKDKVIFVKVTASSAANGTDAKPTVTTGWMSGASSSNN